MAEQRAEEAKRIGRLIAELRESHGWSQQDLANEIDVGVGTVSRWERGLHRSYVTNVRKLAEVLEVAPALLRPAEPEVESQLDRIETKLDRLLALSGKPATPSSEPERVLGDALALLQAEVESRRRTTADRPTSQPEAQRRTSA